ncbi:MAG: hypothetical protein KF687_05715 [Cyclobacteriaceae bacterium]|nr:hypothetical protein [Cyclobacteriaceae bacterium]
MKKPSTNLNKHFSTLIQLGLDQELPREQIVRGKNHLLSILVENSNLLSLNDDADLEELAEELSELAIYIQAFATNCLKFKPSADSPIDITDRRKFRFKKSKLLNHDDYVVQKKYSRKAFDFVHKLYYLEEFGYDKGNDLLDGISITLEPKKLINDKKEGVVIVRGEKFKLPPSLHEEFIRDLTSLVEKFTGRIDMHKDLNAKLDFDSQIIITVLKEISEPYLREVIYKDIKENFPSDPEALLLAFILVTAGILPTEIEYDSKPVRNGGRKVYDKPPTPDLGKIDKTKPKITKNYKRPYITRLREKIASEPEHRGLFYSDKTANQFLSELL